MSSKASPLAACSTPIFIRIHIVSSRRFFGAAWPALVTSYFAVGSALAYTKSAALIVGVAVFSHSILDLIAHPHDLPIYDNTAKVGFGLWKYRDPEFALDSRCLRWGSAHLARNLIPPIRKGAVIVFGILS